MVFEISDHLDMSSCLCIVALTDSFNHKKRDSTVVCLLSACCLSLVTPPNVFLEDPDGKGSYALRSDSIMVLDDVIDRKCQVA